MDYSKAAESEKYIVMTPEGTYNDVTDLAGYILNAKGSTIHICLERDELDFNKVSYLDGVFDALKNTGKQYDIRFFTTEKMGNDRQKEKKLTSRYYQEALRSEFFNKSSEIFTEKDMDNFSHARMYFYKQIKFVEARRQAGLQCRDIQDFILEMVDPELVGQDIKTKCEDAKNLKSASSASGARVLSDKVSKRINDALNSEYNHFIKSSLDSRVHILKDTAEDPENIDSGELANDLEMAVELVQCGLIHYYRPMPYVIENHKGCLIPNRLRKVFEEENSVDFAADEILLRGKHEELSFKDAQHTLLWGLVNNMAKKYGLHLNGYGLADGEDGNAHAERHRSDKETEEGGKTILVSHLGGEKHEKKYRERFFKEIEEGGKTVVAGDRIIDLGIFIKD